MKTIRNGIFMRGTIPVLILISFLGVAGMVLSAHNNYRIGFPLDDAWIHQTYARNIARTGEWAFIPGQPSAGSTAPWWSLLLSIAYAARINPYLWAYLVGASGLALMAICGEVLFRWLCPQFKNRLPLAGVFLAVEWHMVWAGASGMETILQAAIITGCFALLARVMQGGKTGLYLAAGALAGVSIWFRPDGITLLGPVLFCAVLMADPVRLRIHRSIAALAGAACFVVPYLFFNRNLAGSIWPNTFWAKQAEYAAQLNIPLMERITSIFSLPLIGAGLLLLPGALYFIWVMGRKRDILGLSLLLWWVGYSLIYVMRLPVIYQHGRYLMPAMPVFWLLGLAGTVWGLQNLAINAKWRRRLTLFVAVLIAAVNFSFYGLGVQTYTQDVAIIETEMVDTAKWIEQNTPPEAWIAAHDIGALGYFGNRNLVDLAGLVSPEVIPFIRDESRLESYLDETKVDYLVTFPEWYPQLVQRGQAVFTSSGQFAPEAGGENMVVYRWINQ